MTFFKGCLSGLLISGEIAFPLCNHFGKSDVSENFISDLSDTENSFFIRNH